MTTVQTAHEPVTGQAKDWFKSAMVYQIYPRSFADSDGDGVGDLRGIIGKLDYLHRLGVMWHSPVYSSPQDDKGYDISNLQDVDPLFGSLADLDVLIDDLQGRGIRFVMDLVVNHTSDQHSGFIESHSSKVSPKRDWYWWRATASGWRSIWWVPTAQAKSRRYTPAASRSSSGTPMASPPASTTAPMPPIALGRLRLGSISSSARPATAVSMSLSASPICGATCRSRRWQMASRPM